MEGFRTGALIGFFTIVGIILYLTIATVIGFAIAAPGTSAIVNWCIGIFAFIWYGAGLIGFTGGLIWLAAELEQ